MVGGSGLPLARTGAGRNKGQEGNSKLEVSKDDIITAKAGRTKEAVDRGSPALVPWLKQVERRKASTAVLTGQQN